MTAVKNRGLISTRWLLEHKKYYYFPSAAAAAAAAAFVFDFVVFDELFARIKPRGGRERERDGRERDREREKV